MIIKLVSKIRLGSTNQTHSLSALPPSRWHAVSEEMLTLAWKVIRKEKKKKAISTCSMPRNKAFHLERGSAMPF